MTKTGRRSTNEVATPAMIAGGGGITFEMINAGVEVFRRFDPDVDEPEALVYAIVHRALELRREVI